MSFQNADNYRPYEKAQDEYRKANEQRRYIPDGSPRYHGDRGRLSKEELMKHDPYEPAIREQIYREEAEKRRQQEEYARQDQRPSPRYPYYETSYREQFRDKPPRAKERQQRMVPGWYLFLRFDKFGFRYGFTKFKQAMLMLKKNMTNEGAKIVGLATPRTIRIKEGGESWVKYGRMDNAGIQQSPEHEETNMLILVLCFDTLEKAEEWLNTDMFFKQRDFPPPDGLDAIACPIYRMPPDPKQHYTTMVLTEYPKITDPIYFREKFAIPSERCIERDFNGSAYVVRAEAIDPETKQDPVVRHVRGSWIKRNSIVTVSLFPSPTSVHDYFRSRQYREVLKPYQDSVTLPDFPTVLVLDLMDPLSVDGWQ